ncbi:ABC transporter permease [Vannielia litorea]|uniref:Putative spermidine/putrescine transport system permease protein n=1 Tax=Vannielia litorea TaxID=1217970 RepID=A0A1N6FZZ4_9RHOB|nr:ABC transporter permease [Vannielia litorea]SIO00875.1 putative spermidine/putrescine transport system permease protein [Vannielia litorea]
MSDAATSPHVQAETDSAGRLLAADGTPLKRSLGRALRRQKMRALLLIAPLLLFVLLTFIAPIADMLFRSVENEIVGNTLPETVEALEDWDYASGEPPGEEAYLALYRDLSVAVEYKTHTRLGSRLNYESSGTSSLFRQTGRGVEDMGELYQDQFEDLNPAWKEPETWARLMGSDDWLAAQAEEGAEAGFELRDGIAGALPNTARAYAQFAEFTQSEDGDNPFEEDPWAYVYAMLWLDLTGPVQMDAYDGSETALLEEALAAVPSFESQTWREGFVGIDEDWEDLEVWGTIKAYSGEFTSGYFLNSVDLKLTPEGIEQQEGNQRIYLTLFWRTIVMSLAITCSCILLGYPVAWLLANLPMRTSNMLMILVLLPFWTSLLVRTSAWKVLLQSQGVINDILVWAHIISDANRLVMINNVTGTIIAMTHILLPFMILPMYSVMQTIPPTYLRAAKSLGATNWVAFWRVYFPQSVPGIGAGSILVFILAIGYYITPELVGGTKGVFISNRIAYHISTSLNWGLAAALGTILLAAVLLLYWAYDKIVGIDNVKLG